MPTLPSGLKLAIYHGHIMEPDLNWFRAPEGHFWYWAAAEENPPPFSPEQVWESSPATAPVPIEREQMKQHIRVLIGRSDGKMYWRGETIADFPLYGELSSDDMDAWNDWLESDKIGEFIDSARALCETQSEINKKAKGFPVFTDAGERGERGIPAQKVVDNPVKRPENRH
jgi:hypothetical protein